MILRPRAVPARAPGAPARSAAERRLAGAALLLALAAALRAFRLDGQSFWYDEGVTAGMVGRTPGQILEAAAADIHPPLYYLLAALWGSVFGRSELGLRSLSALLGVALVLVVWLLGRRLFGERAAFGAGLVLAVSPLAVYYAQEARMYTAVTLFGALATLGYLAWAQRQRSGPPAAPGPPRAAAPLLGYVLAAAATLYTQYLGALLLAALNLHALATLRGRRLALWLGAQALVALLYLPWLPVPLRAYLTWPGLGSSGTFDVLLRDAATVLTLGTTTERDRLRWEVAAFWVLAAIPLRAALAPRSGTPTRPRWSRWGPRSPTAAPEPPDAPAADERLRDPGATLEPDPGRVRDGAFLAALLLLVPLFGLVALALRRPAYEPKFLLLALPGLALLVGCGCATLAATALRLGRTLLGASARPGARADGRGAPTGHVARWGPLRLAGAGWGGALLACAPLLLVAPAIAAALGSYYFDPRYARDDYRAIAARISAAGQPGDGIVLLAPAQVEVFGLYYRGPLPVYPLPAQRPPDPADTRARLEAIARAHQRLWLVLWAERQADPDDLVLSWLAERAFLAEDAWYGGVRLRRYALADAVAAPAVTLGLQLENGADLVGYTLLGDAVEAGDAVRLALFWRARAPIAARYKVFTQLLDAQEIIVGQRDAEPAADRRPTPTWRPGELVIDHYGVPVRPGTPPGAYRLIVGMYDPQSGQRAGVRDAAGADRGSFVALGTVEVRRPARPPAPAALGITRPIDRELLPGLTLLGYDLHPVNGDPAEPPRAGEPAQLTLYWRADRPPGRDFAVRIELLDGTGRVRASAAFTPGGALPPARWQPGDLLRDPQRLALAGLAPGSYRLRLLARAASDSAAEPALDLGTIELQPRPSAATPPGRPSNAT